MHALTIFIGAFLLFQVQPLIARYILPWFGGSPAVWTTCMLFFQVGLLIGYTYAHVLSTKLTPKKQVVVHAALLAASLLLLPITPGEHLKPTSADTPTWDVLVLLLSTVGIPYIFVSSTGPLLQTWFAQTHPGRSPYRLYALSNAGSLLGLLTYPFIVEPQMPVGEQTIAWSAGYLLFVVCCIASGRLRLTTVGNRATSTEDTAAPEGDENFSKILSPALWIALAASGSLLLLSATNFVCQNVAVMPFLWVLPLSLYLVTFIISFDSPQWYKRSIWVTAFVVLTPAVFTLLDGHYRYQTPSLAIQLFVYIGAMFVGCMVCHGELVRLKPGPSRLTNFYLSTSLGGALGGVLVSLVAPRVFTDFWEFPLAFVVTAALSAFVILHVAPPAGLSRTTKVAGTLGALVSLTTMVVVLGVSMGRFGKGVIESRRNFYGVLRVVEADKGEAYHRYKLFHGQINHGIQPQIEKYRLRPVGYYSGHSGLGIAIRRHPIRLAQDKGSSQGLHVGIIGLGTGVISAYQRAHDQFRFYELDPDVEALARTHFSFLKQGGERTQVVLGDARVSMERELEQGNAQKFDILAIDAFSGDAIPIHLLTTEAFTVYRQHMKPDGIIAVHISNKYFDLRPLLYGTARHFGWQPLMVVRRDDPKDWIKRNTWILLSTNRQFLNHPRVLAYARDWSEKETDRALVWTDDFANTLALLDN